MILLTSFEDYCTRTDQRLCFRYIVQCIYFLNPKFQASIQPSVDAQPGPCRAWSEITTLELDSLEAAHNMLRGLNH